MNLKKTIYILAISLFAMLVLAGCATNINTIQTEESGPVDIENTTNPTTDINDTTACISTEGTTNNETIPIIQIPETSAPSNESHNAFEPNVIATESTIPVESTSSGHTEETTPTQPIIPEVSEEFNPSVPEDTRPPIIIEIPDETQPTTDYETYMNMSEEEQKVFFDSFPDDEAFFQWYNQAKDEYEANNNDIIIDGSTNIEIKP